jgi:3-deoxy-7-phosphoheptulonate synthase
MSMACLYAIESLILLVLLTRTSTLQVFCFCIYVSPATINYTRAVLSNGFADLHKVQAWNLSLDHVKNSVTKREYQTIVDRLTESLEFMKTIGVESDEHANNSLSNIEMFMSHEGLLLDFETQLTRKVGEKNYNLGTHYLWIGDRTRWVK